MNPLLIISGLFQVIFAIGLLQKQFDFTHNDLHINNIMFKEQIRKFYTISGIINISAYPLMEKYLK